MLYGADVNTAMCAVKQAPSSAGTLKIIRFPNSHQISLALDYFISFTMVNDMK